jgi:4-amino-4-deoxy-L-arabinose transferase-like glycosyltransferase
LRLKTFDWRILIVLAISTVNFLLSYYLNTNTIIDERTYATQSYFFYRDHVLPEIYPLLSILTIGPLTLFGVEKQAFLTVPFAATLLTVTLTYYLSRKQFGSQTRGFLASTLVACNPLLIWLSAKHMTENLFALFLVLTFLLIIGEDVTYRQAFFAGTFSFLAYLCRYPGLLLFPVITIWLIQKKARSRVFLAYLFPLTFVMMYWAVNWFVFRRPLTTETYSFGTLLAKSGTINLSLTLPLLGNMAYKVTAAFILVFGYAAILLLPEARKMKLDNPLILFTIAYIVVHLGYYTVLSLSWSFAWSIDHVARYLVPISPLVMSLSSFTPRTQRFKYVLLLLCFAGIVMGLYLTNYSNMHSQVPISWEEFIKDISGAS